MKPIFISGAHGSGKSALIEKLLQDSKAFKKDDFEINFLKEFKLVQIANIFEECLVRLYHRFYTAKLANKKCENKKVNYTEGNEFLIIDHSIYDSLVYIEVEKELRKVNEEQYKRLKTIGENALDMVSPKTIILNPSVEDVLARLENRKKEGSRKEREALYKREDTVEYVEKMHRVFESYYNDENVLYINNNDDLAIEKIYQWLDI